MRELYALIVILVAATVGAACILVVFGGWTWRQAWETWRDGVLFAITLGREGRL